MTSDPQMTVGGNGTTTFSVHSPGEVLENVMFWADGVLLGEYYDVNRPGGLSREGFAVRSHPHPPDTVEIDVPADSLPAGVRGISALPAVRDDAAPNQLRESMTPPVATLGTRAATLAATAARHPCFRDPLTGAPVFLRGVFGASAEELASRPGLDVALKAIGVNCLFTATQRNTARDTPGADPVPDDAFAASQSGCLAHLRLRLAADPSWLILGDGMDWTYVEDALVMMDRVGDAAILASLRVLADTGRVVGIDLCDETGYRLSPAMRPRMERLSRLCREAGLSPCYTTGPGFTPATGPRWSESADFCDHLSFGRDTSDWRTYYPKGEAVGGWGVPSVDQIARVIEVIDGNRYTRTDCPRIYNTSMCGRGGVPPWIALAEIGLAVCAGASGVKVYHLDTLAWKYNRTTSPMEQIGCDPDTNPERWAAVGHAFAAVAEFEARVLQPLAPVQHALGRFWSCRETGGLAGKFWIAVNRLEGTQLLPPVPAWATRVEVVSAAGRLTAATEVPAGGWVVATG